MEMGEKCGASRHFQAVALLRNQSNGTDLLDLHILIHFKLGWYQGFYKKG